MDRASFDNFRNPSAVARFVVTMAAGLAIDLWTKSLAVQYLTDGRTIRWVPGWLHLRYTENMGAVFGLGQGQRWLFLAVSVGAIFFLSYLFSASGRRWFMQITLGLLLAGVLGNMYDRIAFGFVRDMIYALPGWRWPGTSREIFPWIFNIADSLLCTGVGLILLLSLFQPDGEEKSTDTAPPPAAR